MGSWLKNKSLICLSFTKFVSDLPTEVRGIRGFVRESATYRQGLSFNLFRVLEVDRASNFFFFPVFYLRVKSSFLPYLTVGCDTPFFLMVAKQGVSFAPTLGDN